MDFKPGDIVKMKEEVLKQTAKQRSRGKDVCGSWVTFEAIKAGRKKCKFKIINVVGVELYLKWKSENDRNIYCWVHKKHFELKENVEAEDW